MRNKPTASAFDPVNEKMVGVGFVKVVHGPTSAVKSTSCQPKALPANFFNPAPLVQLAETTGLSPEQYGFESHSEYTI